MAAPADGKVSSELQHFLAQEQAKAQIQQTVARVTDLCWDKCMGTPGRSLGSREAACFKDCAQRFLDTTQFIVQRFQAKSREAGGGGLG